MAAGRSAALHATATVVSRTELARDVEALFPSAHPADRAAMVNFFEAVVGLGFDPIAAIQGIPASDARTGPDGTRHRSTAEPAAPAEDGSVAIEPLRPACRRTLWPQRPKIVPGELFSSWLARCAVAAGAEPRRFARDALGTTHADLDQEASALALLRLALATGQPADDLAAGVLRKTGWDSPGEFGSVEQCLETALERSPMTACQHVALHDGGLVLTTAFGGGRRRPRCLVQYCPLCLAQDEKPHFRRGWRLAYEVACHRHRLRLHDGCWRCGAPVDPLGHPTASRRPACGACAAPLADAPRSRASAAALDAQRAILVRLYAVAVFLDNAARDWRSAHPDARQHDAFIGAMARCLTAAGCSVAAREDALSRLTRAQIEAWFVVPAAIRYDCRGRRRTAHVLTYDDLFGRPRSRLTAAQRAWLADA